LPEFTSFGCYRDLDFCHFVFNYRCFCLILLFWFAIVILIIVILLPRYMAAIGRELAISDRPGLQTSPVGTLYPT
jgi:hypothetical protein